MKEGQQVLFLRDDQPPLQSDLTHLVAAALICGFEFANNKPLLHTLEEVDGQPKRSVTWSLDGASKATFRPQFAATDRPVVVLQPPWYRRSARHGLRFYDAIPGLLADQLDQLPERIAEALLDPPKWEEARRQAVHRVYGTLDGQATQRAVAAIQRCRARLKD